MPVFTRFFMLPASTNPASTLFYGLKTFSMQENTTLFPKGKGMCR
jgi:hypothetical protein